MRWKLGSSLQNRPFLLILFYFFIFFAYSGDRKEARGEQGARVTREGRGAKKYLSHFFSRVTRAQCSLRASLRSSEKNAKK